MDKPSTVFPSAYDAVPYPGRPHAQTHPDRLATIATLFGMAPVAPDRCRLMELGCGDGTNLLPVAFGAPHSHCVGIDLAAAPLVPFPVHDFRPGGLRASIGPPCCANRFSTGCCCNRCGVENQSWTRSWQGRCGPGKARSCTR